MKKAFFVPVALAYASSFSLVLVDTKADIWIFSDIDFYINVDTVVRLYKAFERIARFARAEDCRLRLHARRSVEIPNSATDLNHSIRLRHGPCNLPWQPSQPGGGPHE